MKFKLFEKIDFIIIICVLILTAMGVTFIYSSGIGTSGAMEKAIYTKQIIWASVGLILMIVMALVDYRISKKFIKYLAIGLLAMLLYVKFFGATLNNAKSWIKIGKIFIQPSEIGKIIFIMFLAWYLDISKKENQLKRFMFALIFMVLPVGFTLLQPDFGTASVYIPIFLFMCFMAGCPIRYIVAVLATGLLMLFFAVLPVWETKIYQKSVPIIRLLTNRKLFMVMVAALLAITLTSILGLVFFKKRYFYWISYVSGILMVALLGSLLASKFLKEYQIARLIIFLDPYKDYERTGWNIINSQIAIGSGGFHGKGFLMGTQSHNKYLPQQSTDFIFSILAEESGFLGCMAIFVAYLSILFRIIRTIRKINDFYGICICSGVLGMLFFHFLVNVGMVMGVMPVTGIPLPFVSYGGSTYLTNAISLGLVMSARARKKEFSLV